MANSALGVRLNGRDVLAAAVASWPNEWAPPKC